MNSKVLSVVFLTTTIVFGALYFSKSSEIPSLEVDNPLNQDLKNEKNRLAAKNKVLNEKIKKLEDQLELAKSSRPRIVQKVTGPQNKSSVNTEPGQVKESRMAKIMSDPKVQEMMKTRRNEMIDRRYSYLFKKLNLTEDDKAELTDLLGERAMIAMSSRMKQYANRDDDEALAKTIAEKEASQADVDAKIANLLGNNFDTYADFSKKREEYDYLRSFNRDLDEAALSDEQTDKLATVLNETGSNYVFTNEKFNQVSDNRWALRQMNEEERTAYAKELEIRDELVLKEAEGFLDESQYEALKKKQERDRERLKSGRRGFFGRRR